MSWNSIVICICLLLAVFSVYKEFRRTNRSRLVLRIIAVLLGISALACLALPVSYRITGGHPGSKKIVLLTAGFHPDSLNNYLQDATFTLDTQVKAKYHRATLIDDIADIPTADKASKMHICSTLLSPPYS